MPQMVFINLPVTDIARSRTFYESLGFSINPQFSDDETACVVVSDTIFMTHGKFAGFSPRPIADTKAATSALIALTRDSREAVDAFGAAVVANGGSDNGKPQHLGFMYGQSYSDPDGHVLEVVWMDPSAVG